MVTRAEDIGKRIEQVIKAKRISRAKLGESLGVGEAAVGRYIRGEADPGSASMAKIAELGGVSIDWLITGREPEQKPAELTDEEIAGQILARPGLRAQVIKQAAMEVRESPADYGDSITSELITICQRLPKEDRITLLKTAQGLDLVNESREYAGGGSDSAERNSA